MDTPQLTRERVVLMIADGARPSYDLDTLRLLQGCYLVSQRGRRQWRAAFNFTPDTFPPVDAGVLRARDALLASGLLEPQEQGAPPALYLSERGAAEADRLREELGDVDADWLLHVGAYVTSRSYGQLLDEIHGPRPEFVVRSLVAR